MVEEGKSISIGLKREWFILMVIVLIGFAMRLYGINLPLVDSHQIRQAQTAMVARNLFQDNMNIFRTRLDFFGNVPGYIIMEFPLMHAISALLYYLFGVQEIIGRLVSVAFSIGAMLLMYGLARRFLSVKGAFAALALYALSPMNIYFSRAFMLESSMMFFMVGSVYFALKWLDKQSLGLYWVAVVFAAFNGLVKPTSVMVFIPIFTAWFLRQGKGLFRRSDFWVYLCLTFIPALLWAAYAYYFNKVHPCDNIGFGGNWLYLITARGFIDLWFALKFYKFLGGSIIFLLLTPLGFVGAIVGILRINSCIQRKVLFSWLAVIILYFYIFAGANSGHIYYHLPFLPLAAIFFGFAAEWIFSKGKFFRGKLKNKLFVLLSITLSILILFSYVAGYFLFFRYMYSDRMPYVLEVSEIIKKNAPKNRFLIDDEPGILMPVISYYSHSKTQFLVMGNAAVKDLEALRAEGATTFAAMETKYGNYINATKENKELWRYLNEECKPVAITDHYMVFDLRR
jgi:4-amino-4-deoxy-L-arabinose transferase-like glycosyltransferase